MAFHEKLNADEQLTASSALFREVGPSAATIRNVATASFAFTAAERLEMQALSDRLERMALAAIAPAGPVAAEAATGPFMRRALGEYEKRA